MNERNDNACKIELVVDNTEPQLKPDGGGPTQPPVKDWLSSMKSGTDFRVRDKTGRFLPSFLREEYTHGGKLYGNVLLIPVKSMNDPKTWSLVEPVEYCKIFECTDVTSDPE